MVGAPLNSTLSRATSKRWCPEPQKFRWLSAFFIGRAGIQPRPYWLVLLLRSHEPTEAESWRAQAIERGHAFALTQRLPNLLCSPDEPSLLSHPRLHP